MKNTLRDIQYLSLFPGLFRILVQCTCTCTLYMPCAFTHVYWCTCAYTIYGIHVSGPPKAFTWSPEVHGCVAAYATVHHCYDNLHICGLWKAPVNGTCYACLFKTPFTQAIKQGNDQRRGSWLSCIFDGPSCNV